MRVGDIIAEPILTNKLLPKDQVEDRVNELLECVGLANYMRNRYPHEFSGGQRQRVGIARALAVKPKLIVCDEPVSALDVSIQAQVLNLLDELKEQFGLTYLFIAHGLNVVKHVSDRVGVMYLGKMMEIAPKKALYADPLSPYTQALLSAIPSVDPAAKRERIILEGDVPSPIDPPPGCRFAGRCFAKVEGCDEVVPPLGGGEARPPVRLPPLRRGRPGKGAGGLRAQRRQTEALARQAVRAIPIRTRTPLGSSPYGEAFRARPESFLSETLSTCGADPFPHAPSVAAKHGPRPGRRTPRALQRHTARGRGGATMAGCPFGNGCLRKRWKGRDGCPSETALVRQWEQTRQT